MTQSSPIQTLARLLLALLLLLAPALPARAEGAGVLSLLVEKDHLLWQRINEARANPRQVIARLGLAEEAVAGLLGDEAWLLAAGLPPLAWDDRLATAARAHGGDMFANLYYSHHSPAGLGPAERIAAAGYQALAEGESLSALVFSGFVDPDLAAEAMLDSLLRDELTGQAPRRIFAPGLAEVGIALQAQSVALFAGQPYVYLLVIDYARPAVARSFALGAVEPGATLLVRNMYSGLWDVVPLRPASTFQYALSGQGEVFALRAADGSSLGEFSLFPSAEGGNVLVGWSR